jgi:hypothetical protein
VRLGLTTMWHLQKALVDAIVARADQQDLMMSWRSQLSTQEALNGRILLRGEVLLGGPAPADIQTGHECPLGIFGGGFISG